MKPTSEQALSQSKFVSAGERAASLLGGTVLVFIAESSSATSILRSLLSQQMVAPLQASLGKQPELLVPRKFLQVLVFSRAEHPNLASPHPSCAPVPTALGTSAFLSTLIMKTDVERPYSLHLPAREVISPPVFNHAPGLRNVSVMQITGMVLQMIFF